MIGVPHGSFHLPLREALSIKAMFRTDSNIGLATINQRQPLPVDDIAQKAEKLTATIRCLPLKYPLQAGGRRFEPVTAHFSDGPK